MKSAVWWSSPPGPGHCLRTTLHGLWEMIFNCFVFVGTAKSRNTGGKVVGEQKNISASENIRVDLFVQTCSFDGCMPEIFREMIFVPFHPVYTSQQCHNEFVRASELSHAMYEAVRCARSFAAGKEITSKKALRGFWPAFFAVTRLPSCAQSL